MRQLRLNQEQGAQGPDLRFFSDDKKGNLDFLSVGGGSYDTKYNLRDKTSGAKLEVDQN